MMRFREQMQKDLTAVCLGEFGERVNLNGQVVPAVLQPLELEFAGTVDERVGVRFEGVVVQMRETDAAPDYIPGKAVMLNSERWFTLGTDRAGCLLTLKLYRERS